MSPAMKTLGRRPKPNQMASRGAMATMGVTFTRMARGRMVFSRRREWAISAARAMATVDPTAKPARAP
jgi:hypothetical protein